MKYNYNVHIEELIEQSFVLVWVEANRYGSYFLGVFYDVDGLYFYDVERPTYDSKNLYMTMDVKEYEEITCTMSDVQLDIFTGALSVCRLYLDTAADKEVIPPNSVSLTEGERPQQRPQQDEV